MSYESTYEFGRKPFQPNLERGYWASPQDFLYACWGVAFNVDFFNTPWYNFFECGIFSLIPYFISIALFVVPIIFIQSYLGQFSSSGFISAFRIAPLFKGMGYIALAINFMMICHSSVFAAVPMFYLFHSMRPVLPWSCEAFQTWSHLVPTKGEWEICTNQTYGTYAQIPTSTTTIRPDMVVYPNASYRFLYRTYDVPSVLYFRSLFKDYDWMDYEKISLSWELIVCMIVVWSVVALVFYKIVTTEMMGKFIRYTIWLLVTLILICIIRLMFLPYARKALGNYLLPNFLIKYPYGVIVRNITNIPLFTLSMFGNGWGYIISLASFNKFRANTMRSSWFVALGTVVIIIMFGLMTFIIDSHYSISLETRYYNAYEAQWLLYLATGSIFSEMELPNLWSIIFFSLLMLSGFLVLIIQLFVLFSAIFDEFEFLRAHKKKCIFSLIGLFFLLSIYYCTNQGLFFFSVLPNKAIITQSLLSLLLLLVVVWIYGRERLQRDIEFMLSQRFATWRVYILRFVAPVSLLFSLLFGTLIISRVPTLSWPIYLADLLFNAIPWLFIPGYAIYGILHMTGSFGQRFKLCCRPNDWYPVEPEERQRFEDHVGNMDVTHQLTIVEDVEKEEKSDDQRY